MDPSLLYALREVNLHLVAKAQAQARRQGLGLPHMFALRTIAESDGITHGTLAERLHVTPGSLTPTIQRLRDAGLVERRQDADDGRRHHLHLSPAGRRFKTHMEATMGAVVGAALEGWPQDEITMFQELLARFAAGLARPAAP